MQPKDSSIFADVSDYFGIDNPAIAEKDYYVVADSSLKCNAKPPFLALQTPLKAACTPSTFVACCSGLSDSAVSPLLTLFEGPFPSEYTAVEAR